MQVSGPPFFPHRHQQLTTAILLWVKRLVVGSFTGIPARQASPHSNVLQHVPFTHECMRGVLELQSQAGVHASDGLFWSFRFASGDMTIQTHHLTHQASLEYENSHPSFSPVQLLKPRRVR